MKGTKIKRVNTPLYAGIMLCSENHGIFPLEISCCVQILLIFKSFDLIVLGFELPAQSGGVLCSRKQNQDYRSFTM